MIRKWLLAVVPLMLIVGCGSSGGVSSDQQSDRAYIACQDYVSAQLKSPGSASFPGVSSSDYPQISGSGSSYEVVGVVDSENGFGAKLRSVFDCKATVTGGSWSDAGTTVTASS